MFYHVQVIYVPFTEDSRMVNFPYSSSSHPQGKFISTGLWGISRHPNYLGEIMLWSGLYLSASSVMSGYQHISVVSPIFVYLLLTRLSGVPILERMGMKRYGQNPKYLEYVKNTAVLIPGFW